MLSNDRQTHKVLVEIDSEDNSSLSRTELLHLLLVLFESVEEDGLLSSKSRTQREKNFMVQYQSTFFQSLEQCSVNQKVSLFCGFAFAFDLATTTFTLYCDAC